MKSRKYSFRKTHLFFQQVGKNTRFDLLPLEILRLIFKEKLQFEVALKKIIRKEIQKEIQKKKKKRCFLRQLEGLSYTDENHKNAENLPFWRPGRYFQYLENGITYCDVWKHGEPPPVIVVETRLRQAESYRFSVQNLLKNAKATRVGRFKQNLK